ncbi:DoxX family protein [Longispora urticae]
MAPLIALVVGSLLFRGTGWLGVDLFDTWPEALRGGLALMFLVTGIAHFHPKLRGDMIAMVPPALPAPALLVTATGVLELAGAAGLLFPPTARLAAICLGLLLLAMFPANVYAARAKLMFGGRPATALLPRTVEQVVFLAACVVAAL